MKITDNFSWIFQPFEVSDFIENYWAKKTLRIDRFEPTYYESLLRESELDHAVSAATRMPEGIEILNGDKKSITVRDHIVAIEAVQNGKSIRIAGIHRHVPAVARLKCTLEQHFSCPVNINMYLTPDTGKALGKHYDTHDVFVLQIAGSKKWKLYGNPVPYPLEYLPTLRVENRFDQKNVRLQKKTDEVEESPDIDEFVHQSGDFLYIPRGVWHEAEGNAGTVSCHLTVGLQVFTYAELVSIAIGHASEQISTLREALPIGFASDVDARAVVRHKLENIGTDLQAIVDTDKALATVSKLFLMSRRSPIANKLFSLAAKSERLPINLLTRCDIPIGVIRGLVVADDEISLIWHTRSETFPTKYTEACRYIVAVSEFTPISLPGELTNIERMEFVRRLVDAGLAILITDDQENAERSQTRGWLPIKYLKDTSKIKWLRANAADAKEPFFRQFVQSVRMADATGSIKVTSSSILDSIDEEIKPSGFIFHISRCGSTLLSNALRSIAGTIVISEAPIISQCLTAKFCAGNTQTIRPGRHDQVINIIRSFGQRRYLGEEKPLLFKFTSWNILQLKYLREFWPEVPCLIVIREPSEVIASCLENAPGWMAFRKDGDRAKQMFELSDVELKDMTDVEFCSWAIGRFLVSATEAADSGARIIDYKDINVQSIESVASYFNIEVQQADREKIQASLAIYSKDRTRRKKYHGDPTSRYEMIEHLQASELVESTTFLYKSLLEDFLVRA